MKRFPSGLSTKLAKLRASGARKDLGPGPWDSYKGLAETSLALVGLRIAPSRTPAVNVLLPEVGAGVYFAGMRTALVVAAGLARELGTALRVLSFGAPPTVRDREWLSSVMRTDMRFEGQVELLSAWRLGAMNFGSADLWLATYWTTAHALDVAIRSGLLSCSRVVYLVQDYEPSFFAGSTESALAQSTYHANFHLLVNSTPVRDIVTSREGVAVREDLVFAPELDVDRLQSITRTSMGRGVRVGFYARPSKPRNSFNLGVAALRIASQRLGPSRSVDFISMGEAHPDIPLGNGRLLRSRGKVSWSEYFEQLADIDVLLSLQQSPHPSHPPLDMAVSGGIAVVNDFDGTRQCLSPRLISTANHPESLADGVIAGLRAAAHGPAAFDSALLDRLGVSLESSISALARQLREAS